MNATDELRAYAGGCDVFRQASLNTIADHIDEEHERELREQYNDGYDEGFASADDWDVDHADELAEHGWVRLPRDEDGVPIRVGDRLDGYNDTTVVKGLTLSANGWDMVCNNGLWHDPEAFTHHKDTVEDVLREFADRVCSSDHIVKDGKYLGIEDTGLLAEYAEKLLLARDAE